MGLRKGNQAKRPFQVASYLHKAVLISAVVVCCFLISKHFKLANYFPIKTVRVYGLHHEDPQEVEKVLTPLVHRGFFSVNVDAVKERLQQMPWIANVFVRLYWPERVEIKVIEKNAIAMWNDKSLLSDAGELFSPQLTSYPAHLPKFNGPEGKQMVMMTYFNDINRLLTPLHVRITYLELTPYLSWKLTLDNGISLQIGHKDILTRLDHFVKVYAKIVGDRAGYVSYVDLRYPNGLAIRWKDSTKS